MIFKNLIWNPSKTKKIIFLFILLATLICLNSYIMRKMAHEKLPILSNIDCKQIELIQIGYAPKPVGIKYQDLDADPCWLFNKLQKAVSSKRRAYDPPWRLSLKLHINNGQKVVLFLVGLEGGGFGVDSKIGSHTNFTVRDNELEKIIQQFLSN